MLNSLFSYSSYNFLFKNRSKFYCR